MLPKLFGKTRAFKGPAGNHALCLMVSTGNLQNKWSVTHSNTQITTICSSHCQSILFPELVICLGFRVSIWLTAFSGEASSAMQRSSRYRTQKEAPFCGDYLLHLLSTHRDPEDDTLPQREKGFQRVSGRTDVTRS